MAVSWIYARFFFNDTATTEIYALSLHDALPIFLCPTLPLVTERRVLARLEHPHQQLQATERKEGVYISFMSSRERSEEHTSALQSRQYLVCRLMLENHITLYLEFCLRLELYQYK